jgi:hypothetical protein
MQHPAFLNGKTLPVVIACLILAGIPAALAQSGAGEPSTAGGTIIVMSFPAGATVSLNGEFRGIAPVRLENVPPGKYEVAVSLAGYGNDSVPVEIFDGSTREIGFTLERASPVPVPAGSGSIAVDSTPGGAAVLLDGKPAGTTPRSNAALVLNDIPAGSHTITVELAGYPAFTGTVNVINNQVTQVNADLATQSPPVTGTTVPGTPAATAGRQQPVPLSPLGAVAAAALAGLVLVLRRT